MPVAIQTTMWWKVLGQRGYEIVFYVSFVCGHYFVQYRFMQVCIFYLFFWKPRFLSVNVCCFLLWKIRTFEREFVLQTCSCIFENFWNMQLDVITYGSICGKCFMICTCRTFQTYRMSCALWFCSHFTKTICQNIELHSQNNYRIIMKNCFQRSFCVLKISFIKKRTEYLQN